MVVNISNICSFYYDIKYLIGKSFYALSLKVLLVELAKFIVCPQPDEVQHRGRGLRSLDVGRAARPSDQRAGHY